MRIVNFTLTFALVAVVSLGTAGAQCTAVPNVAEDFETTSLSTTCATGGTIYPSGWSLDGSSGNNWNGDVGGTSSVATGPSVDSNPGTAGGVYLYTETSGCGVASVAILNSPVYDVSTLTNPCLVIDYHMFGATMGTLAIESWDGASWVQQFSLTGDQGDVWVTQIVNLLTYNEGGCTASKFRVLGTSGSSFTSDMAIDNAMVVECPTQQWNTNSAAISYDVDGTTTDAFFNPAQVAKTAFICPSVTVPAEATFNISSNAPGSLYDIVLSSEAAVGASTGGIALIDGQIVNIDLFALSGFSFLGGSLPLTLPGASFPGSNSSSISVATATTVPGTLTSQAVLFGGVSILGFTLSQAVQYDVATSGPVASLAGPIATTENVSIDVTTAPTCWCTSGVPFYGTNFNQIHVSANGYVSFGGTDTDTSPSVLDAIGDDGRIGFWTDLDPSEGGTVTVTNPSTDVIRIDYVGVFYNTGGPGNTFGIELDCATGTLVIDGLLGIANNSGTGTTDDQWLGISPGTSLAPAVTTDPGATPFALGGNGVAGVETDMLYEFNDTSLTLSGIPASVLGGMNSLTFIPTPVGLGSNYTWIGM